MGKGMAALILAPLPLIKNLFTSFLKNTTAEDELAAGWCRDGDQGLWFSRSTWSLVALSECRRQLTGRSPIIWLPEYFDNSALLPLRESGAEIVFYKIKHGLSPDEADCYRLAAYKPPDIFVLVHFFGKPIEVPWVVHFIKKYAAWLIEDATHVFNRIPKVGELGDVVLYSPHKHLAIPDGALLVVCKSGPSQLASNDATMTTLNNVRSNLTNRPHFSKKSAVVWFGKRALQRLGIIGSSRQFTFQTLTESPHSAQIHPRMSGLSERLLPSQILNLTVIASKRKTMQVRWMQLLSLVNYIRPALSSTFLSDVKGTPYLASFVNISESEVEHTVEFLQRCDLPVTFWLELPQEVLNNQDRYAMAISLRQRVFFLPVHQSLPESKIVACWKKILKNTTVDWKLRKLNRLEWNTNWAHCNMVNMLQSWEYGEAKERAVGWKAYRILVSNQEGKPVGLAQLLLRRLPALGFVARLNRGPLLIGETEAASEVPLKLAILNTILIEARRQHWLVLQVAPELPATDEARIGMQILGFNSINVQPWGSGILDLKFSNDELHSNLSKRWKRSLRKSATMGVKVICKDLSEKHLNNALKLYSDLQDKNKFEGLDRNLILHIRDNQSESLQLRCFVALIEKDKVFSEPVGYRIIVYTGKVAFDFLVATNAEGKNAGANCSLYWAAIIQAKADGLIWFDIGGLNESTPKGIAEFKRGINASHYDLVGEWRKIIP